MTTHTHPKPALSRIIQYGALIVTGIMLVAVLLQVVLAFFSPGGAFFVSAVLTLMLAAPVLMLTAYAPPVTADEAGITLQPLLWQDRFVPWHSITAVKIYPLLPAEESEITRRAAIGRQRYRAAAGIMLVIPGLPPQYRIAGFFAGERGAPVVALTNRAHTDYETLRRTVLRCTDAAVQADNLQ